MGLWSSIVAGIGLGAGSKLVSSAVDALEGNKKKQRRALAIARVKKWLKIGAFIACLGVVLYVLSFLWSAAWYLLGALIVVAAGVAAYFLARPWFRKKLQGFNQAREKKLQQKQESEAAQQIVDKQKQREQSIEDELEKLRKKA